MFSAQVNVRCYYHFLHSLHVLFYFFLRIFLLFRFSCCFSPLPFHFLPAVSPPSQSAYTLATFFPIAASIFHPSYSFPYYIHLPECRYSLCFTPFVSSIHPPSTPTSLTRRLFLFLLLLLAGDIAEILVHPVFPILTLPTAMCALPLPYLRT